MTVPGIEKALIRLGISEEVYAELFVDFQVMVREKAGLLKEAIAAADLAQATKLAHTIKGSAANLGIDEIAELARVIECSSAKGVMTDDITSAMHCLAARIATFTS